MDHSFGVGLLAFALCLVVCLSASAAAELDEKDQAPVYIIEQAKKAVETAKESTKELLKKAHQHIQTAGGNLGGVVECKKQSEKARSQAELTRKGNQVAGHNVENIRDVSKTGGALKLTANEVVQNNVASLCELLKEAEKLEGECDTELLLIKEAAEEYKDTNNNVSYIKSKVEILTTHITDILTKMNEVQSTTENTEEKLTNAQLANLHVSAIVAVAKIQTMIKEADINIKETQNKADEVNCIVKEMKKHCTTKLIQSYEIIKEQCKRADTELTKATSAVANAKTASGTMTEQKGLADTALANVQKATDISKTQEEVIKVQECVANVNKIRDQMKSALETDENVVAKAKDSKQKLLTALTTTTTAPSTAQNTETAKSNLPVSEGTGTDQKDAITQPKITNTEPPTSNKSPDQSDNSAAKLKDALSKGAQNVPTTALTGGKAPAPGAENDSAMTVSVPLLVALIASAVLQ